MYPNIDSLRQLTKRLDEHSIPYALGGSALLRFYSCDVPVNDWDITTDANIEEVRAAIEGLDYIHVKAQGIFASSFLFILSIDNVSIDLIGNFGLHHEGKVFSIPTKLSDYWNGIPVGDPVSWIKAYEIMGRKEKAELLRQSLLDLNFTK
jgi:hypothetical protein